MRSPLALLPLLVLPACGDIVGAIEFADDYSDFESRANALESRDRTYSANMPDTGSATFRGEASLAAGTQSTGVLLVGDAVLNANFGSNTVTGQIDNMTGFDRTDEFIEVPGTLTLNDGVIGQGHAANIDADLDGTIAGDGYNIRVDGAVTGDFRGNPAPVGALLHSTGTSQFILNGELVPGGVIIAVQ